VASTAQGKGGGSDIDGGRRKGIYRARIGETRQMGGMQLKAVEKDGAIKWEPINSINSINSELSREASRAAARDEERWFKRKEDGVKDERVQEAKDIARRERQRKADLFGAEHVYRTTKVRTMLVTVPPLLAKTREEEAAARRSGMDRCNPKAYQFLKESLDALEREHADNERTVREQRYQHNRRRLGMGSSNIGADDEVRVAENDGLQSRLAKMSEEEFKQLAFERKKRAEAELSTSSEVCDGAACSRGSSRTASSSGHGDENPRDRMVWVPNIRSSSRPQTRRGSHSGASMPVDPKDDPDYRR